MSKPMPWRLRSLMVAGLLVAVIVSLASGLGASRVAAAQDMAAAAADSVPAPVSSNWEMERRVRRVAQQVRCLICRGQSVWDSQSGWALERKEEIRAALAAGRSEQEILGDLVDTWGSSVLMRPPMAGFYWIVWLLPATVIVAAGAILIRRGGLGRRRVMLQADPPTAAEEAEIERRLQRFQD